MSAAEVVHLPTTAERVDDPPLFAAQMVKNKRRGKAVAKILAEFDYDERVEIADEAAEDCDFGWGRAL